MRILWIGILVASFSALRGYNVFGQLSDGQRN